MPQTNDPPHGRGGRRTEASKRRPQTERDAPPNKAPTHHFRRRSPNTQPPAPPTERGKGGGRSPPCGGDTRGRGRGKPPQRPTNTRPQNKGRKTKWCPPPPPPGRANGRRKTKGGNAPPGKGKSADGNAEPARARTRGRPKNATVSLSDFAYLSRMWDVLEGFSPASILLVHRVKQAVAMSCRFCYNE